MRLQDLMKEENWGKVYEYRSCKYKFENGVFLILNRDGWEQSRLEINQATQLEFAEVKQPYTFMEAVNDDEHEYYPEGYEWVFLNGIHHCPYIKETTDNGFRDKAISTEMINGNWYRK